MTDFECSECLNETLQELQEDARLIHLALLGAQVSMDELTLACLLRLTDYLNQHVSDLWVLCKKHCGSSC